MTQAPQPPTRTAINPMKTTIRNTSAAGFVIAAALLATSCKPPQGAIQKVEAGTAAKVYVPPGEHDEMYNFVSGGFNGQVAVYGLPSGRLFRIAEVHRDGCGFAVRFLFPRFERIGPARDADDACACLRQRCRDGAAETGTRASHAGDLALNAEAVGHGPIRSRSG